MRTYRDNGALGAILDEYEKAIEELKSLLGTVSKEELLAIADATTLDEDCRSIQSVMTHVVRAGYWYTQEIRQWQGEPIGPRRSQVFDNSNAYSAALDQMMAANIKLFEDYPALPLETLDPANKILVSWKQRYDVEQLMEHAIVHILRHRRQIERFLQHLRS